MDVPVVVVVVVAVPVGAGAASGSAVVGVSPQASQQVPAASHATAVAITAAPAAPFVRPCMGTPKG